MFLFRQRIRPETWAQAKYQRQHPTLAERGLWNYLRSKGVGHRVHRQKVIMGYVVDFWCPAHKLAIEIDGGFHDAGKDALKDERLARIGITVLRLPETMKVAEMFLAIDQWINERRKVNADKQATRSQHKISAAIDAAFGDVKERAETDGAQLEDGDGSGAHV